MRYAPQLIMIAALSCARPTAHAETVTQLPSNRLDGYLSYDAHTTSIRSADDFTLGPGTHTVTTVRAEMIVENDMLGAGASDFGIQLFADNAGFPGTEVVFPQAPAVSSVTTLLDGGSFQFLLVEYSFTNGPQLNGNTTYWVSPFGIDPSGCGGAYFAEYEGPTGVEGSDGALRFVSRGDGWVNIQELCNGTDFAFEIVTDTTNVSTTDPARSCAGDWNADGVVSVSDILGFLSAWSGDEETTDMDGNRLLSVSDILDYLSAWSAGCV